MIMARLEQQTGGGGWQSWRRLACGPRGCLRTQNASHKTVWEQLGNLASTALEEALFACRQATLRLRWRLRWPTN